MEMFDFKSIPNDSSLLDAGNFVQWKRESGMYNFKQLPKTALITLFNKKRNWIEQFKLKKLIGLNGSNYSLKSSDLIICEGHKSGGASLINLCEELRVLGVKNFIFLGLGGSLDSTVSEGDLHFISEAWSGSGTSYYYDPTECVKPKSMTLADRLLSKQTKLSALKSSAWSTDAPFRESKPLIDYYRHKGARLVEMECASLYAFANHYHLNAACFVIASDQLTNQWAPPKHLKQIIKKGQATIQTIINIFNQ